jgi:hypothetical protein
MELDKIIRQYGFSLSEHDGYYVKEINYDGEPAFIYITGLKVCGVPQMLDEPILVMMYSSDFDEIREPIEVESLRTYISSLKGDSVLYRQTFEEGCSFPMMLEKSGFISLCRCHGSPSNWMPEKLE